MGDSRRLPAALLTYAAVGGANTAVTAAVMALLAYLGSHYALYTLVGYFAGFANSYVLNARLTFRARASLAGFGRFLAANVPLFGAVSLLQAFLIEICGLSELVSVGVGMVTYTLAGFVINKLYTYRA